MAKLMTGAEMVIRALRIRASRRCSAIRAAPCCRSMTRCSSRTRCVTSWSATSRARSMPPRAMPARPARSACVLVTSGPGATNAVTGLTDALMDSIPLVCITGQVPTASDRQRRLPGMRHRRHHAATAPSTIIWCKHDRRSAARAARGVSRRAERPAGSGRGRYSEGRAIRQRRLCRAGHGSQHKSYRPKLKGDADKIEQAVDLMIAAQAAGLLHRRRRHQFRPGGVAAAARTGRAHRLSDHLDPDGPWRLSGLGRQHGSACSACTAPSRPIWPCMIAT